MSLGFAPLMYPPDEYRWAFGDLVACRYDGVDLALGKIDVAGAETVADRLEEFDLDLFCVMAGWLDSRETVRSVVESIPTVADLGATYLGVIAPQRGVADAETSREWLETVATSCREHGLAPVVHHHAGSIIDTPEAIDRFLSRCDLGLLLDTGHYHLYGDCVDGVERFGDRIEYVHLKDVAPSVPASYFDACVDDMTGEHPIPSNVGTVFKSFSDLGEGEVPFEGVFDALADRGYDGPVTVEVEQQRHDPVVHAKRNADVARDLLDGRVAGRS